MYIQEFDKKDVLFNIVKTNPSYEFILTKDGAFVLTNRSKSYQLVSDNKIAISDYISGVPEHDN